MAPLLGSSASSSSLGRVETTRKTFSLVPLVLLISTCLRGAYSTNLINNPPIVSPLEVTSTASSETTRLSTAGGINQLESSSAVATGFVAEWTYTGPWDADLDDLVDQQMDIRSSHFSDEEGDQEDSSFPPAAAPPPKPPIQSSPYLDEPHPTPRSTPGTWQAGQDSWFLFGGQPPTQSNTTASDLWQFNEKSNKWRQIYSSTNATSSSGVQSSHPENMQLPHLCGSLKNGLLAVFGLQNGDEQLSQSNNNDDNTVWLFDTKSSNKEDAAVWTSYICCDACLPDDTKSNNSLDSCPKFKKSPMLWCASDSLLALQASGPAESVSKSTPYSRPIPNKDPMLKKRIGGSPHILWKFDLYSTQWEKVAVVSDPTLSGEDCRPFEGQTGQPDSLLYLVCRRKNKGLEAKILVLDPKTGKMHTIPYGITLNKAFARPKLWLPQYSVLSSLEIRESNLTLLFAGYHKLVDLWIHNRTSDSLLAVENIWKGSSLHVFQRTSTFYHLSVAVGQVEEEATNYTLFMVNPRSKYQEFYPGIMNSTQHPRVVTSGRFHISILSDQGFFLPSRDVSYLLKASAEQDAKSAATTSPAAVSSPAPHQSQQASAVTKTLQTSETSTSFPLEQKIDDGHKNPSSLLGLLTSSKGLGHDLQAKDSPANPSKLSSSTATLLPRKQIPGKSRNLNTIAAATSTTKIPTTLPHAKAQNLSKEKEQEASPAPPSWTESKKKASSACVTPGAALGDSSSAFPEDKAKAASASSFGHRVDQSRIKTYPRTYPSLTTAATKPPQVLAATLEPLETEEIVFQSTEELAMSDAQFASLANKQQQPEDDFGILQNRVPFHQFREDRHHEEGEEQEEEVVATSAELVRDAKAVISHGHHNHHQHHHIEHNSPESPYSSMLFFAFSLSIFASIGIVVFVRRCVKCPPTRESALIVVKEPPPIRYNVIPDELSFHHPHTPIY